MDNKTKIKKGLKEAKSFLEKWKPGYSWSEVIKQIKLEKGNK